MIKYKRDEFGCVSGSGGGVGVGKNPGMGGTTRNLLQFLPLSLQWGKPLALFLLKVPVNFGIPSLVYHKPLWRLSQLKMLNKFKKNSIYKFEKCLGCSH